MKLVLEQEDTDANFQVRSSPPFVSLAARLKSVVPQIHAADKGPKVFSLGTVSSNGYNSVDVSRSPPFHRPKPLH